MLEFMDFLFIIFCSHFILKMCRIYFRAQSLGGSLKQKTSSDRFRLRIESKHSEMNQLHYSLIGSYPKPDTGQEVWPLKLGHFYSLKLLKLLSTNTWWYVSIFPCLFEICVALMEKWMLYCFLKCFSSEYIWLNMYDFGKGL